MITKAIREHEAGLARTIVEGIAAPLLAQWRGAVTQPHESGTTVQSWLGEAPAKHSSRQIEEVPERIELLTRSGRGSASDSIGKLPGSYDSSERH